MTQRGIYRLEFIVMIYQVERRFIAYSLGFNLYLDNKQQYELINLKHFIDEQISR